MSRRSLVAALAGAVAFALLLLVPAGTSHSQGAQEVYVVNFPRTQQIEGAVSIAGPVHLAASAALKDVTVAPVGPKETTRWVQAGTIRTEGFAHVVLSLTGALKGEVVKPGSIAAVLIPDEEPVIRAFDERGEMQFPLEVEASAVSSVSPYFSSTQARFDVGFPNYRVYVYNTCSKTASVSVYAYLTN